MEQKLSVERKKKISPHGEDVPLPLGLPNTLGRYSHDLQAPGFEPRWVASQLEALPTAGQFSTITYQQMDNMEIKGLPAYRSNHHMILWLTLLRGYS